MPDRAKGRAGLIAHEDALGSLFAALFEEVADAARICPDPTGNCDLPTPEVGQRPDRLPLNEPVPEPLQPETAQKAQPVPPVNALAGSSFRALFFRVGDFRLAVPLQHLRGVFEFVDRLTRVPAQPAWHLGLVRYRGQSVVAADLGLLVGVQARCRAPRYLLLVGDGRRAIACDAIEDAVLVEPKAIRWARRAAGKAWLMGLVTKQMRGLLDADAVAEKIRHG